MTVIRTCTCDHEYQDERYGDHQRVHNVMQKESECRCTVCGKVNTNG